jgi:Flp pilus assembly protein TadB
MPTAASVQKKMLKKAKDRDKQKAARKAAEDKLAKKKKALKKAEKSASPMAKRFTKMTGRAPSIWAIVFVIVIAGGVLALVFGDAGPSIKALVIVGSLGLGIAAWAFQSVANPKNHKK